MDLSSREMVPGIRKLLGEAFPGVRFRVSVPIESRRWMTVSYTDGPDRQRVHEILAGYRDTRQARWGEDGKEVRVWSMLGYKLGYSTVQGFQVVRSLGVDTLEAARRLWENAVKVEEGENAGLLMVGDVVLAAATEMEQIEEVADRVVIGQRRRR